MAFQTRNVPSARRFECAASLSGGSGRQRLPEAAAPRGPSLAAVGLALMASHDGLGHQQLNRGVLSLPRSEDLPDDVKERPPLGPQGPGGRATVSPGRP
jgi:hypothetical protein